MKGELAPRKIAVESQLSTLTALGHTITDASFIKMIGTQLAAHRIETGTNSANSEVFEQPGVEKKIKPNVNVTYHRDREQQEVRRCFACNGNHLIDRCEKSKCEFCKGQCLTASDGVVGTHSPFADLHSLLASNVTMARH